MYNVNREYRVKIKNIFENFRVERASKIVSPAEYLCCKTDASSNSGDWSHRNDKTRDTRKIATATLRPVWLREAKPFLVLVGAGGEGVVVAEPEVSEPLGVLVCSSGSFLIARFWSLPPLLE